MAQAFDQGDRKHPLHAGQETEAADFSSERFPGARIIQRKLSNRHPAHGDRQTWPFAQRLFKLIFLRPDQYHELSNTGALQRQHRPLKKADAYHAGEGTHFIGIQSGRLAEQAHGRQENCRAQSLEASLFLNYALAHDLFRLSYLVVRVSQHR